jgi:hypothetical protein
MDIRKFFGTGATSVTNIVVTGKFTPLGRSQIRSQRGRSPPPRATRGRKCPVEPKTDKPGLVHGLVRGGRKNPVGTFWINQRGVVARTGSTGMNKFKGCGSRDYCPTASFIGWDGSCLKMQCGCDSGESAAATIIQKYARRMIVLNGLPFPAEQVSVQECHKCGGEDLVEDNSNMAEFDYEDLVEDNSNMAELDYEGCTYLRDTDTNKIYCPKGCLVGNAECSDVEDEFSIQFIEGFDPNDTSSEEETDSDEEEINVIRETYGLNDEEWDEESLVRETYGRHTYNFGDTRGTRLH